MKKIAIFLMMLIAPVAVFASGFGGTPTQVINLDQQESTSVITEKKSDVEYVYYWGNWCPHCAKVNAFFDKNQILDKYNVSKKEIWYDRNNAKEMTEVVSALWIPENQVWVPFMVFKDQQTNNYRFLNGDTPIISYFAELEGLSSDDLAENTEVIKEEKNDSITITTETDNKNNKIMLISLIIIVIAGVSAAVYFLTRPKKWLKK